MNSPLNLKESLRANNKVLQEQFEAGDDIALILRNRSKIIDGLLQQIWAKHQIDKSIKVTLVAVGGYGREEMHPASDIDLLVLLEKQPNKELQEKLSDFVTELWDLGLEIGHSVRTLSECVSEAKADLTVITNLIEARFVSADEVLFTRLQEKISSKKIWKSPNFFKAKIAEQEQRYKRFGDTAYRVEPNLKDGPGGLRDLQMIGWITMREYGISSLKTLSESLDIDLLNAEEYRDLIEARDFLWKVRFVLHQITGRKEDRLLFDHQRQLAHSFGFTNDEKNQSIEAFMQRYYKTITQLERLNEILLGLLREQILENKKASTKPINELFSNRGGFLDLSDANSLKRHPPTFWHIFNALQLHPELKGLTARTIRELRRNLHLINDEFRANDENKALFIKIISQPTRVNFVLRRMNRYGVLAAYIPVFANIVGRMQYDLFHAYTVDDHTLNVVRNIRRLSTPQGTADNPFCSELFNSMKKPMLLVLAGIFHDIAKGREGSHSELGAIDALEFCRSHKLSETESQMVSWLVENHLLLSGTAQRKDINDPDVIKEFCAIVNTQNHLDFLYVLTICDIKGTNPTLLTSWKHSLLKELYKQANQYLAVAILDSNQEQNQDRDLRIEEKKQFVLSQIAKEGIDQIACENFWARFNDDYFQQFSKQRLLWHIGEISQQHDQNSIIRIADSHNADGTVLLVYAQDQSQLFIKVTSAIEQQGLNIVGASITSSKDDYDLQAFYVLDRDGQMLTAAADKQRLLKQIEINLEQTQLSYNFSHHRMPRQLKHFDIKTTVSFALNERLQQTTITIITADGAGLLTRIGGVFYQQGLAIVTARITTLGEIAEDIFQVTSSSGKMITDTDKFVQIKAAIIQKLES